MSLRYVQSKDGKFVRHIHDVEPTQWDADNFCFARRLTEEQAERFGVTKIQIVTAPYYNPATQSREEGPAIWSEGIWYQTYVVNDLSDEEAVTKYQLKSIEIREARDRLIAETDWTQCADISQATKDKWAPYRKALRDVPQQAGFPFDVIWPT